MPRCFSINRRRSSPESTLHEHHMRIQLHAGGTHPYDHNLIAHCEAFEGLFRCELAFDSEGVCSCLQYDSVPGRLRVDSRDLTGHLNKDLVEHETCGTIVLGEMLPVLIGSELVANRKAFVDCSHAVDFLRVNQDHSK